MKQKDPAQCCCCKELTKYICMDCSIDNRGFVALCEKTKCRDEHEKKKHEQ